MSESGSFHAPAALPPRKDSGTQWTGDWVDSRGDLNALGGGGGGEKEKK